MIGMRSMIRDMRSRLVGHELTPKLVAHAFPEGLDGLTPGLHREVFEGLNEQIQTARFMHPNQIRFLQMLPQQHESSEPSTKTEIRRANRFLLALLFMSGNPTPRCRKLIARAELDLGEDEVDRVHQEIDDAIHDLTPLTRSWT